MKKIIFLSLVVGLVGCSSAPINLPTNIKTIPTGMGDSTYIDTIDKSFGTKNTIDFEKLKLCAIENFTNDSIVLKDSAGSFIGAYTGNYYQNANSSVIQGGNVLKYSDAKSNTVIASGRAKTKHQQGGLVVDIIQYDVKLISNPDSIKMIFMNIKAAQENTGVITNTGFRSIGTWSGARAPAAIETLDRLADKFKRCID